MKSLKIAAVTLFVLWCALPLSALIHRRKAGPPPDDRCLSRADVTGLPLIELAAENPGDDTFAVMLSGDGGWRRIDEKITDDLRRNGIPVVGFLTPDFFRERKTPAQCACALERVIRTYALRWHRSRVLLVGYSRGADVLPFMASRLPEDVRASIRLIVFMGLEPRIDFKYHSFLTFGLIKEPQFPVRPEVEKLRGLPMLCVFGEKEKDSICHQLDPSLVTPLPEPGAHHFAGQYGEIAEAIRASMR